MRMGWGDTCPVRQRIGMVAEVVKVDDVDKIGDLAPI